MIIATAGHVDHGKTALVRALTGQETDRTEEERRRGLSIELGYAWLDLPGGGSIDLVDVPGHARFMRTLLAGVGAVDAVMLVVAADDGLMPQTMEHLRLVELLGLPLALIVLSKCGRVDPARIAAVSAEILQQTRALKLPSAPVLPVDSLTGSGLFELRAELERLTLRRRRDEAMCIRLLIDRHFTVSGIGQVVTGTLVQGTIRVGDQLALSHSGSRVRVRGLQIHGEQVMSATAGQRCAVNLAGDLAQRIQRGVQLLEPDVLVHTHRLDLSLNSVCESLPRQLQLHLNGASVNARLVPLGGGATRLFQAVLDEPLACQSGDRSF